MDTKAYVLFSLIGEYSLEKKIGYLAPQAIPYSPVDTHINIPVYYCNRISIVLIFALFRIGV